MAHDLPPAVERPKRRRPNREQRQHLEERAFRLRLEGWTTRQIADELQISVPAAWRYYTAAREKVAQHLERGGSAALTMELARLDAQTRALWPLAMGHTETRVVDGEPVQVDVAPDVEAHHALLAINKARRAMLGLDVPKEVSIRAHLAGSVSTVRLWGFDPLVAYPDVQTPAGAEGANGQQPKLLTGPQDDDEDEGSDGGDGGNGADPSDDV